MCILKDLKVIEKLDVGTKSTLQSNIIYLERYTFEQLVDIIVDRVNLAFKPNAVPEDTISLIAELARSEGGNARFAIELLWRAGKYADAEELETVVPECVRRAVSGIYAMARKSDLAYLSLHERLLLLGIARFFKENERAYASMGEVEQAYAVVCEEFDVKPHTHTQLWKYLQSLSALGILKKKVSLVENGRGRTTLIYLIGAPLMNLKRSFSPFWKRKSTNRHYKSFDTLV